MADKEKTFESDLAPAPRGSSAEVGRDLASRPYTRRYVLARTDPIRVVLVDDHHLVRAGLRSVLQPCPDVCVVGEAADGMEAVALTTRVRPDVVVMALDMPKGMASGQHACCRKRFLLSGWSS